MSTARFRCGDDCPDDFETDDYYDFRDHEKKCTTKSVVIGAKKK